MGNPVTTAHPFALLSEGEHAGFRWEVVNNGIGYRCGYLCIPEGHPWHGQFYDDIRTPRDEWPYVHGGLTFAEQDTDNAGWWIGFDCAHAGDAPDPSLSGRDGRVASTYLSAIEAAGQMTFGYTIRTTAYAEAECRKLANQAREVQEKLAGKVKLRFKIDG